MSNKYSSWDERHKNYTESPLRELNKITKGQTFRFIETEFSGGNDQGSIDRIYIHKDDVWRNRKVLEDKEENWPIEDQFWRVLVSMYGSFAGEYTTSGYLAYYPPSDSHPNGLIESEVSEYILNDNPESYYDDGEERGVVHGTIR